jgi:hypothetical protein
MLVKMPETCFGSATIEQGSPLLIENPTLWSWQQICRNPEAEQMSSRIHLDYPGLVTPEHPLSDIKASIKDQPLTV